MKDEDGLTEEEDAAGFPLTADAELDDDCFPQMTPSMLWRPPALPFEGSCFIDKSSLLPPLEFESSLGERGPPDMYCPLNERPDRVRPAKS